MLLVRSVVIKKAWQLEVQTTIGCSIKVQNPYEQSIWLTNCQTGLKYIQKTNQVPIFEEKKFSNYTNILQTNQENSTLFFLIELAHKITHLENVESFD